jgi:hypothetical protein
VRLVGDASWFAVFNLDEYKGKVFHQVRHPLPVVASLAGTELVAPWAEAARQHRARYIPLSGAPLVDAMRITADYVDECERIAARTWKVEEVDAELVLSIGEELGSTLDPEATAKRLAEAGDTVNARGHASLAWDDLPAGDCKRRLKAHAKTYGYA